jgi:steroid 5-alpha reductase family enzyme
MFKVAYFAFLAALVATPVQLAAGNSASRVVVLALLGVAVLFAGLGFQRRP